MLNYFEKILFTSGIWLNFLFYGILNISFYYMLPNSIISGSVRCIILVIGSILMLADISKKQYRAPTLGTYTFLFYVVYMAFVLLITPKSYLESGYALKTGLDPKLFFVYTAFIFGGGSFLLLYCGINRFRYFVNTPSLVYIPSLITVVIILLTNIQGVYAGDLLYSNIGESNRMMVKLGLTYLMVISLYYLFFGKNIKETFIYAPLGIALSLINIRICDSRSIYVSLGTVALFYIIVGLLKRKYILRTIVFGILGAILTVPYILTSHGMERLSKLAYLETDYLSGNQEVDRLQLLIGGYNQFMSSPILGGSLFQSNGTSCHCFSLDILMATGLIGGLAMAICFFCALRGMLWLNMSNQRTYWVSGLFYFSFVDASLHGDVSSPLIFALSIMLVADSYRKANISSELR